MLKIKEKGRSTRFDIVNFRALFLPGCFSRRKRFGKGG